MKKKMHGKSSGGSIHFHPDTDHMGHVGAGHKGLKPHGEVSVDGTGGVLGKRISGLAKGAHKHRMKSVFKGVHKGY